jgi:hypothetical protein
MAGRILGRLGALILGIIGVVLGFVVNFAYSGIHRLVHLAGGTTMDQTHGFIGLLLILVGLVGTMLTLVAPETAAILLLISGVGFFFIVGWYALLASPFLILAAILAWVDRRPSMRAPAV